MFQINRIRRTYPRITTTSRIHNNPFRSVITMQRNWQNKNKDIQFDKNSNVRMDFIIFVAEINTFKYRAHYRKY